jgi:hypothetical protein
VLSSTRLPLGWVEEAHSCSHEGRTTQPRLFAFASTPGVVLGENYMSQGEKRELDQAYFWSDVSLKEDQTESIA